MFALLSAAHGQAASTRATSPALDAPSINPQVVKAACSDALLREESRTRKISLLDVTVLPGATARTAGCMMNVLVQERERSSSELRYKATYAGVLELDTGHVTIARFDEPAAKEAALSTLAGMFIELRVVSASKDKMTYQGVVNGQSCTVVVGTSDQLEPRRWLVSEVNCKGKKSRNEKL